LHVNLSLVRPSVRPFAVCTSVSYGLLTKKKTKKNKNSIGKNDPNDKTVAVTRVTIFGVKGHGQDVGGRQKFSENDA